MLALDQDSLGKPALRAATVGPVDVYMKELADGSRALGFFNRGDTEAKMNFNKLNYLGLGGTRHVRDLWRQVDLPDTRGSLRLTIPAHGVMLVKVSR